MNEELKVIISAEIGKLKQNIAAAKGEINQFASKGKADIEKVNEAFEKAGSVAKSAFSKLGTALAGAVAAIAGVSVATQEYRDDMAKLSAAYESANLSTNAAKTAYQDLYRVLGETDTAVEASQQIALLAESEADVAKWSGLAADVVGKFGDALMPETFFESANETLRLGEATGAYVQMLEGTGKSVDEFNAGLAKCKTEAEKQAYMLKVTEEALAGAGDAYAETNAKVFAQRDAQIKLQEALAMVGDAVAPVVTAFTVFAGEALAAAAPYLQSFAENYLPAIKEILSGVADALGVTLGFISEHVGLLAVIAGIITGITIAIGLYNTVAAIKTAMDIAQVTTLGALIAAYIAQAAAMAIAIAPYALIVAAIAAVIAIIVVCVKHWDEIKEKVKEVWSSIKEFTSNAVESVKNKFEDMKNAISNKVDSIKKSASDKFQAIKDSIENKVEAAKSAVSTKFDAIKSGISSKVDAVKSKVTSTFNAVKSAITTPVDSAKNAVKTAIDKMKSYFNFKWSLPKLKMPHISISGTFSLNPPKAPKFSISWHKLGGVFDSPHLFPWIDGIHGLGEDGAEAIVPLEKNTQWLDKIADKLSARQGNVPIILQVDGKTFAQTSIDSINALTRQQGKLTLNLA